MKIFRSAIGTLSLILAAQASPVSAAPQILAVMSSLGPQQMQCSESACVTTLTSYCLQEERDVPTTGQAYQPAHVDQFALIATTASGEEKLLNADGDIRFSSVRGFTMVRATIPTEVVAKHGIKEARLVAHPGAALVPVPVAGDPNPITEAELAFATRSLREHGEQIVDNTPDAQAAALVNRIATTIVPKNAVTDDALEQLWHNVIDGLGHSKPLGQDAIDRARDIYDWCQDRSSYHSMSGIKSCLEFKHDDTIMRLNTDYWKSQPGY